MNAELAAFIRSMPFVCPKCHRRFPRNPHKGWCPTHLPTHVAVLDQTELGASR